RCAAQSPSRRGDPPRKEGAMIDCHDFDEVVSPYLSGELEPARRSEFTRHLEGCAACRAELADQRRADELLRASLVATPVIAAAVAARVRERMQAAPWWRRVLDARGLTPILASAALVLAIFLAVQPGPDARARAYLLDTAAADHVEDLVQRIEKPGWAD